MKCIVDNQEMFLWQKGRVLKKYNIDYYRCPACGMIRTEKPFWLDEAYSEAIVDSDIGLIKRNIDNSHIISAILKVLFNSNGVFLDYAGGYGMFVRLMRDEGFDFEWHDRYCKNIFAKHFEKRMGRYEAVTAFEVMEHLEKPTEFLNEVFKLTDSIIFSTMLVPEELKSINDWWYFSPEEGQHISFFTEESLEKLGSMFSKSYVHYEGIHMYTDKPVDVDKFVRCCVDHHEINRKYRMQSLMAKDYKMITGRELS